VFFEGEGKGISGGRGFRRGSEVKPAKLKLYDLKCLLAYCLKYFRSFSSLVDAIEVNRINIDCHSDNNN
jgi:hypothetical protein